MENMKVFIENIKPNMSPSPYNGKGKFIVRLAEAMKKKGIEIVSVPKECDINLRMNGLPTYDYGIKVVRLDDVAFSNDVIHKTIYSKGLKKTKYAIKYANGVIYQSNVAKNANERILDRKAKNDTIIYNGTDPYIHKKELVHLPQGKNFVHACQKLFPQRRVDKLLTFWDVFAKDKDDVFLHLVHDKDENFEQLDIVKHKNVIVHDIMIQEDLDKFVHSCDAAISIKYQDSCPNFVIESIAVGTPVIISNTNGLAEILKEPHVTICNIDPYYTFEKVGWERPPFENKEELINALEKIYNEDKKDIELPNHLHIDYVAERYIEFFKELIKENKIEKKSSIVTFINSYLVNKIKKRMGYF